MFRRLNSRSPRSKKTSSLSRRKSLWRFSSVERFCNFRRAQRKLAFEPLEDRRVLAAIVQNPLSFGSVVYQAFPGETNDVQVDPSLFLVIDDDPSVTQIRVPPCVHSEFLESFNVSFGVSFIASADLGFNLLPIDFPDGILCPSFQASAGAIVGSAIAENISNNAIGGSSAIAGAELAQTGNPFLSVEADSGTVNDYQLYQAVVDPAAAINESEAFSATGGNDTAGTADAITAGRLITGNIGGAGDRDIFSFTASVEDRIAIIMNNNPDAGNPLSDPNPDTGNFSPKITLSHSLLGTLDSTVSLGDTAVLGATNAPTSLGTYFVEVESNFAGDTDYEFVVVTLDDTVSIPNPATDQVNEVEPNGSAATADQLTASTQFGSGIISFSSDIDFWEVTTGTAGDKVFAFVDTQNAAVGMDDTFLTLFEQDGTTTNSSDDDGGTTIDPVEFDEFIESLEEGGVDIGGLTSLFDGSLRFIALDGNDVVDLSRVDYNLFVGLNGLIIDGGTGNDTLLAGGGDNELTGGTDNDTYVFNKNFDSNVAIVENVGAGEGEDTILIEGTPGNDIVTLSRNPIDLDDLIVEYARIDTGGSPTVFATTIYDELLTGNNVERLVFQGGEGDDLLKVDSTGGAIRFSAGINYVAGDGTDRMEMTGGTATANQYFTGPGGSGTSLITIGGVTQIINFEGMDPIVQSIEDTVAGPLEVFATQFPDTINLKAGPEADLSRLTIINEATVDFGNKTALTINAAAGADVVDVQVGSEQGFAAGANGSRVITVNGQDGEDIVRIAPGLQPLIATILNGGANNDQLFGGDFGDTLNGGAGNDLLDGGLSLSNTLNSYSGSTGDDTILVSGTEGADSIQGVQGTNSTILWSVNGSANRFDVFSTVEQFLVDAKGGDDAIELLLAESITQATTYVVDGGANNGADELTFVDNGPGDRILLRQGPDDQSGTIYPDALGPIVYEQIENVEFAPQNPVTGGTGNDGNGRVIVLDQDPFEFNDSLVNATDIGALTSTQHNPTIDVGGDEDWYHFRAPKIGTFSFEILFDRIATLPNSGELQAALYREDGTLIVNSTDIADGDVLSFSADRLEDYYLRVEGVNGTVINVYDVNLLEVDLVGPQVFDPDGAGPLQAVQITSNPNFDLFNPKPTGADQGPTPVVNSITVNMRDILNRLDHLPADLLNRPVPNGRAPGDLYPALDALVAALPGHFELRGDHTGIVPIQSIVVNNNAPIVGEIATATVELVFAKPLADDRYTFTIFDTLTDPPGNAFDGNSNAAQPLENPTFPSGDNVAGGDFVGRFTIDSRPEIASFIPEGINIDINGNFVWDPATGEIGDDATNVDLTFTLPVANPADGTIGQGGYTVHDILFAGKFSPNLPQVVNNGFDQLAAYGNSRDLGNVFRWLIDTNSDGVINTADGDILSIQPTVAGFNVAGAIPIAGNFDGNAANGDEIGLYNIGIWALDTNRNFVIDAADNFATSDLFGTPIVGDFDGNGVDDLGVFNGDVFSFDLSFNPVADANATVDNTFEWGFPGVSDRPIAADMDQDGIDDIGLWVPRASAQNPEAEAEWYFLISNDFAGANPVGTLDALNHPFEPTPFGNDLFAEFGNERAAPLVGNFDPPIAAQDANVIEENPDFDGDGDVDGADFLAWQLGYGMATPQQGNGDADGSNTVDGADLAIWSEYFGSQAPLAVAAASGGEASAEQVTALASPVITDIAARAEVVEDVRDTFMVNSVSMYHLSPRSEFVPANRVVQSSATFFPTERDQAFNNWSASAPAASFSLSELTESEDERDLAFTAASVLPDEADIDDALVAAFRGTDLG